MNKNRIKILIIFSLIFIMIITTILLKNTYAKSEILTRNKLQDIIVSASLSYLYNNHYSDYSQTNMDDSSTFNWRTLNQAPEMVSRNNKYYIDCSSFVSSVYINTLGYDFKEFYKLSNVKLFLNNEEYLVKDSNDSNLFQTAYKNYGKGLSTTYFSKIGRQGSNLETTSGIEYINNSNDNNNIVVYYYKVTGSETNDEKIAIRNNIKNLLEPGDIIVYRNELEDETYAGHAMLYIGNEFEYDGGFIHSTGKDYVIKNDSVFIGEDLYSIRYDGMKKLEDNIFVESNTKESYIFTILRPLNKYCIGNECTNYNLTNNALARNELKQLQIEQYTETNKNYDSNKVIKTTNKNLSKYNSINVGDVIRYNLYLENKSNMYFCTSGNYSTKESCEQANYAWKQKNKVNKNSNNLIITSKIPENTEFINCGNLNNCTYNKNTNTVTWKISSINNNITNWYEVRVIDEKDITYEGFKIKTDSNNVLELSPIVTKVNPTINGITVDLLKEKIEKFKDLTKKGNIIYDSSTSSAYNQNLDDITNIKISQAGFIKMIYYNTFGIDISYLTTKNIKNAIFNNTTNGYYTKKNTNEINNLTNEYYKSINKMLVKGIYGGRLLKGNDNLDRAQYLNESDLEFGDIVVYFYSDANYMSTYMYYGLDEKNNAIFVRFESDGIITYDSTTAKTSHQFFKEIYSKNLFVVLRPTQLYGVTINYDYNGENSSLNNSFITYDKYNNLYTPTKENSTLNLIYNKEVSEYQDMFLGESNFEGWYSNKELTNKVINETKLKNNSSHTLYAKWLYTTIELPNPSEIEGEVIEGWYNDETLNNKVASPGEKYAITKDETLYAKWEKITNINSDNNNNNIKNNNEIKNNPNTGQLTFYMILIVLIISIIVSIYLYNDYNQKK